MSGLRKVVVPEREVSEEVRLDPATSALLVVDMQNDFVDPRGRLFVPSAPDTVPRVKLLIERARSSKVPVLYTQDWHLPDDPEFKIWGEHAVAETWGSGIIADLAPGPRDLVVRKQTIDPFYGTPLDHYLRLLKVDTVVVAGTVANICVLQAVSGASVRGYNVVYPMDAVSALNEFDSELAVRQAHFVHRALITRAEGVIFGQ
ncbi:MAG TPA: cysteine hydrolase [Nitrososphaeria archaeon]|jgi:nicotinamidase-related amidase|nr:isochorismatase family cysteine hydrolase [Conexivisphaerales archaeon]PMP97769.1 MAG: isochorismatase [Nitrososphaera sp.]HEU16804.1 cysteine hydrolase [Nitrososphaeria archaeon]